MTNMKKLQRVLALVLLVGACSSYSVGLIAQSVPGLTSIDRRLVQYAQKVLTNAQVLALSSTPITIIPAQGAGTIIEPLGGVLSFSSTGAYTVNGSNLLRLWYTSRWVGPAASNTITTTGFLTLTSSPVENYGGVPDNELVTKNQPIVLQDTTGTAFTGGNAANTLTVRLAYRVHNQ